MTVRSTGVHITVTKTKKHVNHRLVRTTLTLRNIRLNTTLRHRKSSLLNDSTNRLTNTKGANIAIRDDLSTMGSSFSIFVSFAHPRNALGRLTFYHRRNGKVIVNAAKFSRTNGRTVHSTTTSVTVIFTTGFDINIGIVLGLLRGTTGIVNSCASVRVVRTRRERGISTPSNATLTVKRTVTRTLSGSLGSYTICDHRNRANRHIPNAVNFTAIHTNSVINRRATVFTSVNRHLRVARGTSDHVAFTGNTMESTL